MGHIWTRLLFCAAVPGLLLTVSPEEANDRLHIVFGDSQQNAQH